MKIEIKLEGDDIGEIVKEIGKIIEANTNGIRKLIEVFADEAIEVVKEPKILDKGANLYVRLNREINRKYKKGLKGIFE